MTGPTIYVYIFMFIVYRILVRRAETSGLDRISFENDCASVARQPTNYVRL